MIDRTWIIGLPKAENHVHLEGCLDPAIVERAAARAGVAVPSDPPRTLDELLHLLDVTCRLMTEADDLTELAAAKAVAGDAVGVSYTDLIVNPAHWPPWAGRIPEMIEALDAGFASAEAAGSKPTGLSLSIGRHQSAEDADEVADALIGARTHRIVGVSVDGNESAPGAGCERFAPAIERIRSAGLRVHVHTGESGGPDRMRLSIDHLHPDRIDHGIRAVDDPDLVAELAATGTPLAICPTSNLTLGFVDDLADHPLAALRAAGVVVTINTDDPLLLETDLAIEYERCVAAFGWNADDLRSIAAASVQASTAPVERQAELVAAIRAYPDPSEEVTP